MALTFHDRRNDSNFDFAPSREDRLHSLYGSGEAGLQHLFGGAPKTPVPWAHAARRKSQQPYAPEIVKHELLRPRGSESLAHVDPRRLLATQPSLTRGGVHYYMGNQFRETGQTFADQHNEGNRYPVVYAREKNGEHEEMLLSGHHRAAAALLRGEPLHARRVVGPWGPPR